MRENKGSKALGSLVALIVCDHNVVVEASHIHRMSTHAF